MCLHAFHLIMTQLDSALFDTAVDGNSKKDEAFSNLQVAASSAAANSDTAKAVPNPTIDCHSANWIRDNFFAQTDMNGAIFGKT